MLSKVSLLSSMSCVLRLSGWCGRMLTNSPSDMLLPRTSWKTKMKPSFSYAALGASTVLYWSAP